MAEAAAEKGEAKASLAVAMAVLAAMAVLVAVATEAPAVVAEATASRTMETILGGSGSPEATGVTIPNGVM